MTLDLTPSELNVLLMICQRADPMDLITEVVAVKTKLRQAAELTAQQNGASPSSVEEPTSA